jgi:nucleoside-diphosphate-sugar epimerase
VDLGVWIAASAAVLSAEAAFTGPSLSWSDRLAIGLAMVTVQLSVAFALGLYQGRFWYGSSRESIRLYVATLPSVAAGEIAVLASGAGSAGAICALLIAPTALGASQVSRLAHWWRRRRFARPHNPSARRLIVFGAGDGGELALRALTRARNVRFVPVALLDDDPSLRRLEIEHVPVMGDRHDIEAVARETNADAMLIAIPSATSDTIRTLTQLGRTSGLDVYVLPGVDELFGAIDPNDIRPVTELDLLGRHPVDIDIDTIANFITDRRVLITGAGGSIGSELCRQVQRFAPASLHMLDCDDSGLHAVELSLEGRALLTDDRLVLADIRDAQRMREVFDTVRPDVVFHAAALKHLTLLERFPIEAWRTNVQGTQNVLDAALEYGVEHFVNISTDKAAEPSSVLGWSKRITERQTASAAQRSGRHYVSVRFGNVLGSRGSVLEIFEAQIRSGGPLTVTHEDATRFFMTVTEAVRLTMNAAAIGRGGQVMVLDMGEPVRIADVARRLAAASPRPIKIEITGLREGEKLHETLLADGERGERSSHPKITHVEVPPIDLTSS